MKTPRGWAQPALLTTVDVGWEQTTMEDAMRTTLHYRDDTVPADAIVREVIEQAATSVVIGPEYQDVDRLRAWLTIPIVVADGSLGGRLL